MSTQEPITFDSLPMRPELQKAIADLGFEKPSPIQMQALPILLGDDTDFIGLAATGTGKTVAFGLPLLERIDPTRKHVQAVIMCPTRELCMQVSGQIDLLGKHLGIRSLPIYGGAGYDEQLRGLRQGTTVVVGTPGRMIDHLNRGTLKLQNVKIVVLDEADEMISMGFKEDMEKILETVPKEESQTWLFSATMSPQVRRVADEFLENPKTVQVNRTEMLSSTVRQIGYLTQEKNKPEVLCKLIDFADDFYGVIFCQMKSLVVDLTRYLSERGYKVDCLHGDMSQAAREVAMLAFREKRIQILVCTDVASRGLDVKDITHVVNYSLPRELDSYVHRIGRTGRAGKAGIAISLITPSHRHLAGKIERMTKSILEVGDVPGRKEIGQKKIARELENFKAIEGTEKALALLDDNWKEAVASMSGEEVAARFLSQMFPWVFSGKFERPQMERTPRPERAEGSAERPRGKYDRSDRGGSYERRDRPERVEYSKGASSPKRSTAVTPKYNDEAAAPIAKPKRSDDQVAAKIAVKAKATPVEIDQDRPFEGKVSARAEKPAPSPAKPAATAELKVKAQVAVSAVPSAPKPAAKLELVPAAKAEATVAPKAKGSKYIPSEIDQDRPFDDGFGENGSAAAPAKAAKPSTERVHRGAGDDKFMKRKFDENRKFRRDEEFRAEDRSFAKSPFGKPGFNKGGPGKPRKEKPGYDAEGFERSQQARAEKPHKPFGKGPSFGGKGRPAFAAKKSGKPFIRPGMKEGSAPPPKFKPRSQRGGELPPRRRPNE